MLSLETGTKNTYREKLQNIPDVWRQYEFAPAMNSLVLAKWSQCLALHGLFES
jgi:hypothetical protein